MRGFLIVSVVFLVFILVGYFNNSYAQTCSGVISCREFQSYSCPPSCVGPIDCPGQCTTNYTYGSEPCPQSSIPGQCSNDYNGVCQMSGFGEAYATNCSSAPTPTSDPCGGGPRSFCGFGGGWYCCGANMTCTGSPPNFGCTSNVPTPTTSPSCNGPGQYGSCAPDGYQFPSAGGYYLCSGGCYVWVDNGANTPTPTTPGGPTSPPATATPGGSGCANPTDYICGGSCTAACAGCNSGWADYSTCSGGGGGGIPCSPNGSSCTNSTSTFCEEFPPYSCFEVTGNNCCSGNCSSGTCQDMPTCTGCQSWNGTVCADNDSLCSSGQTCQSGTCVNNTYSISGNVFVDTDQDGVKDAGESGLTNAASKGISIRIIPGLGTTINGSTGNYTFSGNANGTYSIQLTVPSGYSSTSTNPRSVTVNNGTITDINFGIYAAPPACVPGSISLNPPGGAANPGSSVILSVTACTGVENPNDGSPPPPFSWNPDTGGNNPPPTTSGQTDTPTSSTVNWTAPNCPASQTTYTPQVTVGGAGGTTSYQTPITVPRTVSVTTHVREVGSAGGCTPLSGSAYNSGGTGASVNITGGGGAVNQNQVTNGSTGQASFTCLPQGNYTTTLVVPSGYDVIGTSVTPATETPVGSNGLSFATSTNDQVVVFCIAPINPWFQTDFGDVRFRTINNPVPPNLRASKDTTFPGLFFSSATSTNPFGAGSVSDKGWFVNGEYNYNADTENRNGGMSYNFYKSKASQDGVTITPIGDGTFDQTDLNGTGVYEVRGPEVGGTGNLVITDYDHPAGQRIVILVPGNVTIEDSSIDIPAGAGLFIVAAKGNITIDSEIGTSDPINSATLNTTTTHLDGYYTAQGDIILESRGSTCADGTTSDRRLNIGGVLVANSLKPFSSSGTHSIRNDRSLCLENLNYPSLYISSRPDFLPQLTDFYKTTYSKWSEVNP